jgi:hypothetical protein
MGVRVLHYSMDKESTNDSDSNADYTLGMAWLVSL